MNCSLSFFLKNITIYIFFLKPKPDLVNATEAFVVNTVNIIYRTGYVED